MSNPTSISDGRVHLAWYKPVVLGLLAFFACFGLNAKVYGIRGKYVQETVSEFGQLPTRVLDALTFEFRGVVSDYLFFKTLTYMGFKIEENKLPTQEEWQLINHMLQQVTELDPRFWDPYVFAEMMLAWQAGMFDETEALLEKAALHRPYDYRPLYYIGFNNFYFKKDAKSAAPFLMEASKRPNAPKYLKGLGARMSYYAGRTGIGIFFLENLIKETHDPKTVSYLEKRLTALKMIFYLEAKVKEFEKQYGHLPISLQDLVAKGLVKEIPTDPYGGEFSVLKNGRVYTTSKLVDK